MIDETTKSDSAASESASAEKKRESSSSSKVGGIGKPKMIATFVAIAFVVIVILQNTGPTQVNVLFWSPELPRWILLSLHFAAGAAAGVIIPRWRKRRKEKRPLVG